jgi:CheY-like chemotaxis protein
VDVSRPTAPVLIVEDNEETLQVLATILRLRGYSIATAVDGQEAMAYLADGHPVSLVILDLRMPIMDGWEVCRRMQADPVLKRIPVIAFSANADQPLAGAVATVRKGSLDPDLFLDMIERVAGDPVLMH